MSLLKSIWHSVLALFGALPHDLKEDVQKVLMVTANIRMALNSGIAIAITDIIPGTWDDTLRTVLLDALNKAIPTLQVLNDCNDKQGIELVQCWINELSKYTTDVQQALLKKLADIITMLIHNGELTPDQAAFATQVVYSKMKND